MTCEERHYSVSGEVGDNAPAVSIIMPAYNAERYVEAAIRSVMSQTLANWELIVVDDCSTDGTLEIVRRLAQDDARIAVVTNEENLGVAQTRNKAIDLARGEYVALLDSDDIWFSEKLEKQLCLARTQGADIVYCSYALVGETGERVCDDFIVAERTDFETTLTISSISCSTALLARKVVEEHRFTSDYYHEDYVYWLDLLAAGYQAHGAAEVLAAYRIGNESRASNKIQSAYKRWRVYRDHLKLPLGKSVNVFLAYALQGAQKYRKN